VWGCYLGFESTYRVHHDTTMQSPDWNHAADLNSNLRVGAGTAGFVRNAERAERTLGWILWIALVTVVGLNFL
jgi:hypothetical protein